MEVVAGLSLKNLEPRVWDPCSPYYLPGVTSVMVSYADFDLLRSRRRRAMEAGLHEYLGVPEDVRIFLDNGSFAFARQGREVPRNEYLAFVEAARPNWYPPSQDYIPLPSMSSRAQAACRRRTMAENLAHRENGSAPVVHVGRHLRTSVRALLADPLLARKGDVAFGGIVPNLLRAPKALPYRSVLDGLAAARQDLAGKRLHLFGVGGTATLHLAALIGMDTADSAGWRNRAARGIVQLPGRGDRMVAKLGSWRGREPDRAEALELEDCPCPACWRFGRAGLRAGATFGFVNRAVHNLSTLVHEAAAIRAKLDEGLDSYEEWYSTHVENVVYMPLIAHTLRLRRRSDACGS